MARDDPQMKIRLPADLKSYIEAEAEKAGRSLNAEILHRLRQTQEFDEIDRKASKGELREFLDGNYKKIIEDISKKIIELGLQASKAEPKS
ncbi:Arc family DNA-binding protein [Roseomonas gilardii]|uniref:Arc family DNA-binding protein n=1 Tax=Roseomonas gilardii TaxID=257708 RepID=A0ABU3MJH7_9PROT|nr:Arc family DNA-binding protein [Roseomonas gilardii]MDT8332982.1 Arc family DNA-binding protein [Roseomonas gilardii]